MWLLVIGLLVLAMMVGPVMMLRPSPRDQQLAKLRAAALPLGLTVQAVSPAELGQTGAATGLMFYRMGWPSYFANHKREAWLLLKRNYSHEIHYADHWDFSGSAPSAEVKSRLKGLLQALPEGVSAVQSGHSGLAVAWDERGGSKRLAAIVQWLDDAVTQLALPALPLSGPQAKPAEGSPG